MCPFCDRREVGGWAWTGPHRCGCSCPWLHDPLAPPAPSPLSPSALTQGPLLDVPHFRKPGLKRPKFKYEPAGPVHFFPQSSAVHAVNLCGHPGTEPDEAPCPGANTFVFLLAQTPPLAFLLRSYKQHPNSNSTGFQKTTARLLTWDQHQNTTNQTRKSALVGLLVSVLRTWGHGDSVHLHKSSLLLPLTGAEW